MQSPPVLVNVRIAPGWVIQRVLVWLVPSLIWAVTKPITESARFLASVCFSWEPEAIRSVFTVERKARIMTLRSTKAPSTSRRAMPEEC